ncbi:hypothetical protein HY772_09890 [Candidatus Woesearchaeota archaeon]|nr:hypothetical protein [Candidatus Woesearchaeota archaeon]
MTIDVKKYGFKDYDVEEKTRGDKPITLAHYPKPLRKFKVITEAYNQSIEEMYFWTLNSLRDDWGLHDVTKINDIFTASEQSAFWGAAQQRLQIQQGQVSNYLQTIAKLVRELFQIVRELRILDERLLYYKESDKALNGKATDRQMANAAEVVLRGYWVDLKDGGAKSPGSVYGMATQLGFAILPDLFFAAPVIKQEEVDAYCDSLEFNRKVREVLKRKLKSYIMWKETTRQELDVRRNFTIKFLRQHFNVIRMYLSWVKPYLRNVRRLSMNMDRSASEDLIGAFEGSVIEIEIVARKQMLKSDGSKSDYWAVVVADWYYRTRPTMEFHAEGYQHKGPIHVGRTEMTLRSYAWTQADFENYKRMREEENMELLGSVDEGVKAAIEALGDELKKYLREAGEKLPEDIKKEEEERRVAEKKAKEKPPGALEPFVALFGGFKEIFTALAPGIGGRYKPEKTAWELKREAGAAVGLANNVIWQTYKNFKKSRGLVSW